MIFHPKHLKENGGSLRIPPEVTAVAHPCLGEPIFRELWQNFTLGTSTLTVTPSEEYVFLLGDIAPLPLGGCAYSIRITPSGIAVSAEDRRSLIEGFLLLLDRLVAHDHGEGTVMEAALCEIRDRAAIDCRMVHFCVFPETELWEVQRFLRLAGVLRYTHVVLEFWGMLHLDCLRELSWPHAFSKEEVRPLLLEAQALGLEIVPMFNHLGHASGSRIMHGKHVVLDQNPSLAPLFSEDGWCWDIRKPTVRTLLRAIRRELCELCGEGRYFHVGCDEAFGFPFDGEGMDFITDFLNGISEEMQAEGRRIIAWGDMFLYRHAHDLKSNTYTGNAPSAEAGQYMLARLDRRILMADWQYDARHAPVETALVFKGTGFDTLLCPWDKGIPQLNACIDTVGQEALFGVLHTTWHTLTSGMPFVLLAAVRSADGDASMSMPEAYVRAAALLRRVMPAGGDYRRAGWSRKQVDVRW